MKTSSLLLRAAAAVGAASLLASSPARAEVEYPWCALSCQGGGVPLCSFATIEQCRSSLVSGGYCEPNPRAGPAMSTRRRAAR